MYILYKVVSYLLTGGQYYGNKGGIVLVWLLNNVIQNVRGWKATPMTEILLKPFCSTFNILLIAYDSQKNIFAKNSFGTHSRKLISLTHIKSRKFTSTIRRSPVYIISVFPSCSCKTLTTIL